MKIPKKLLFLSLMLTLSTPYWLSTAHAADTAEVKSYNLPEFVVEGDRSKTYYPGKQVVRESNIGVMGNLDFMSVPLNTISLSKDTLEKNKMPGDTFSQVATMNPSVISKGGSTYNEISIRGFNVSMHDFYLNGVPGLLSSSSIPMNFVENVEIISGPNTLINGVSTKGSVGGSINIVPKTATNESILTLTETFSGTGNLEHAIDFGKRFGKYNEWGIRVNADYANGGTAFEREKMMRKNFVINIDRQDEESTTSLLYGYRNVDQTSPNLVLSLGKQDVPTAPSNNANFQLPWARYKYSSQFLALSHEQKLNNNWKWFLKGGYHDQDWTQALDSYWPTLIDNKGNFTAEMEDLPMRTWRKSIVAGVKGTVETGALTHNVVVSMDKIWEREKMAEWFGDSYTGNIYDNSIASGNAKPSYNLAPWGYWGEKDLSGISLIDRIQTANDKLSFLVGLRQQKIVSRSGHNGSFYTKHGAKSSLSPSVGVMYKFTPQLAMYANYVEGLSAGTFVGKTYKNANEFLEPQKTKQYEVGLKWDKNNLATTISAFRIEQENAYPNEQNVFGYFGRQNNQGIQVTVHGKPSEKLSLLGGFMYLNAKQTGGKYDGKSISGIPHWHATMSLDYAFNKQFSVNGRFLYSSKSFANMENTKSISSWARFDLGANYNTTLGKTPVTVGLNIFNVFDKHYWQPWGNNTIYLGTGRTAVFSAKFKL